MNGGNNNDSIQVGAVAANNITLAGGNGSDTIRYTSIDAASTGFITLGTGQDRVSGGLLNGSVMGGAGNDTVFINNMSASSVIDGGAHNDTIVISTTIASASTINAGDGADSITLAGGISAGIDDREINGGAGNDSITSTLLLLEFLVHSLTWPPLMVVLVTTPLTSTPTSSPRHLFLV